MDMNYGMEDPSSMGMNMGMSGMTGLGNDRLLLRLRQKIKHVSHTSRLFWGRVPMVFMSLLSVLIIIIPKCTRAIGKRVAMATLTVLVDWLSRLLTFAWLKTLLHSLSTAIEDITFGTENYSGIDEKSWIFILHFCASFFLDCFGMNGGVGGVGGGGNYMPSLSIHSQSHCLSSPSRISPRSPVSTAGSESGERYSRKVFVGGLPPDIDEGGFTLHPCSKPGCYLLRSNRLICFLSDSLRGNQRQLPPLWIARRRLASQGRE